MTAHVTPPPAARPDRPRRLLAVVSTALLALLGAAGPAAATPATTTVTGIVQEIVVENPDGSSATEDVRKALRVGDAIVALTPDALPAAEGGDTVRVTLAPAGDGEHRVVAANTIATAPAAVVDAGTHDIHVALVRPAGIAADLTLTSITVTALIAQAAAYWSSQTAAAVRFRVADLEPWYESAYDCADGAEAMWTEALTKFTIPAAADQHMMVIVPEAAQRAGCAYGLGTIGSWSNSPGMTFVSDTNKSLLAHELGHNLGLGHSGALHCDSQDPAYTVVDGDIQWPATCTREEYGDLLDVMGYSGEDFGEGSLNAVHLNRMGLLPTAVQTITAAGTHTVRIAPLSGTPTALRAVRVVDSAGAAYYVEYRTDAGLDTVANRTWGSPSLGVRVLRQNPESTTSSSFVLDATPTGASVVDTFGPAHDYTNNLAVGQTFTTAGNLVTVTVDAADATGASLTIANGAVAADAPAAVALSGLAVTAVAGARATASAAVTDSVGAPVAGWNVRLQFAPTGSGTFVLVGNAPAGVNGVASISFTGATASGSYRAVTDAALGAPAVLSVATAVTVTKYPATAQLTGLPAKANVGAALTVAATVTNTAGVRVPGWPVRLQHLPRGATAYTTIATVTTNSTGVAAYRFTHRIGATYRFVTVATIAAPAINSNAILVTAQAAVTLRRPVTSIRAGRSVAVAGTISAVPAPVVYVQVRYGTGGWGTAGRATVRGTAVTGAAKLTRRGGYQVRLYLAPGSAARYLGAYSTAYGVRAT